MESTIKRVSFALTKIDEKQMTDLMKELGESQSQVLRRALIVLHRETFKK